MVKCKVQPNGQQKELAFTGSNKATSHLRRSVSRLQHRSASWIYIYL